MGSVKYCKFTNPVQHFYLKMFKIPKCLRAIVLYFLFGNVL